MRRLTCNKSMAYLKYWTDNFFQIFFMGTSWVAVSIINIKTRASREMKIIKIFDFNGVNVAKHWHVAGRGICHLWLPCYLAPGGGCEVLFSPGLSVCVSVCVCLCVCPANIWYFISQLLEEKNLTFIGQRSRTVHYFLKVQSYHKNWAIENFNFFS